MQAFRPVEPAMKSVRILILLAALAAAFSARPFTGLFAQAPGASASIPGGGPFDSLHFRPIGPASMSGRISDVAVYEPNPAIFYVGTAHGGVWKTINNGTTFEPEFQDYGLMSIGDVAVSQSNPDLVWVGTGESNNRQSTSWGDGIYKSTNGGKTYANMGLRSSRHINRIVVDPRNNDTVFVAATGPLFGPRGRIGLDVYRKRPHILYASIEGPAPADGRGGRGGPSTGSGRAGEAGAAGRGGAAPAGGAATETTPEAQPQQGGGGVGGRAS